MHSATKFLQVVEVKERPEFVKKLVYFKQKNLSLSNVTCRLAYTAHHKLAVPHQSPSGPISR